jgi:2,4-dienoyl-CoA reductase-like NADH-dependent reductase (Old Yellow Enzyme family)
MSHLFSPLALGPLTLPNRVVIAPMCQYSAEDGRASSWHVQHYGQLAQSGAGLLIFEATAVQPGGRISWADTGLWDDACQDAWRPVLAAIRTWSDMPLGIQLAHAGRKAACHRPWDGGAQLPADDVRSWQTVSASALPFQHGQRAPLAMDAAAIAQFIADFAAAARRAEALGLDLIEIHAAHGYLLHQFLSPLSNTRSDAWGGSLENRMALLLAVFDAVKAAVSSEMAVGVRISATDWVDGGWDLAQSIELARVLEARGCHFLHVSSGGLDGAQQIPVGPGYQVPLAQAIKAQVAMPVIAVGLITEPTHAEAIVATGQADAVGIARGILYNPRWPWHAAAALGATVSPAPQYLRCEPRAARGLFA